MMKTSLRLPPDVAALGLPGPAGAQTPARGTASDFAVDAVERAYAGCPGKTAGGRDNTLGCRDCPNCETRRFPQDTPRWITVPATRSRRVEAACGVDRDGIALDVRIPLPLPVPTTSMRGCGGRPII